MASSKSITDFFPPSKRSKRAESPTIVEVSPSSNSNLAPEQKLRVQLNQSLAKAKRNRRICAQRVSKSNLGEGLGCLKLDELLVEETWLEALPGEFDKPYAKKLSEFVESEIQGSIPIYPPQHLIFNALNSTPFDKVKSVIIGQDPYHGPGQAMGLSFSVPEGIKVPSSLINIYKELKQDLECSIPSHGNLERWAVQGVLLLNAVLTVEETWLEALPGEFDKPYAKKLSEFVESEIQGSIPIYPPQHLIFNALNSTPFDKVKSVIIGQDPYHGPGQAMGLSFSVPEGIKVPSSLINIYKELKQDLECSIPSHGNLERWAVQGVLLLNAVLTVRQHQANSHAKKGWEQFTDSVIETISKKKTGIVFLLWGNYAQAKSRLIDESKHHILKAAHPSGLSAHRGFFGCGHFSSTNRILEKVDTPPIDWQL